MAAGASAALATFEIENGILPTDTIYKYDNAANQRHIAAKPWVNDVRYFKHVRISALALVKMVMHARGGGSLEIMGLMLGKIDPDDPRGPTMIVMDVFALPVEGTETRVNAQADAYEYMVEFLSVARESGRMENVLGWYHSHPGYGCWMSGIDVSTQMLNQQFQEPWLAIVIDPVKTAATGKVDIGAFRTYPQGHKPPEGTVSE
jgi:COP9 signalosome complex subunit 5